MKGKRSKCRELHFYALLTPCVQVCKDSRQNSVRWMTHKFVFSSDAYPMSKFDMTPPSSVDLINEQPLNPFLIDSQVRARVAVWYLIIAMKQIENIIFSYHNYCIASLYEYDQKIIIKSSHPYNLSFYKLIICLIVFLEVCHPVLQYV